jgi:hypothetical protein
MSGQIFISYRRDYDKYAAATVTGFTTATQNDRKQPEVENGT